MGVRPRPGPAGTCAGCQLILNGFELIQQAGLSTEFDAEGDFDHYAAQEPEYGND
ncbi:hypothetical protein ABZS96_41980 [Streptomyces avermitilis]|uniref:hypothetical protein n=1 Tax=Streptomyces avermitilis TaxID=33903 RepID=UPI0033B03224